MHPDNMNPIAHSYLRDDTGARSWEVVIVTTTTTETLLTPPELDLSWTRAITWATKRLKEVAPRTSKVVEVYVRRMSAATLD